MHIQRICGQSRLVTHCVLEGLGVCLTIAPRVGTVKLARVGRSLLEPDATGERAVRLASPLFPQPHLARLISLSFLPPVPKFSIIAKLAGGNYLEVICEGGEKVYRHSRWRAMGKSWEKGNGWRSPRRRSFVIFSVISYFTTFVPLKNVPTDRCPVFFTRWTVTSIDVAGLACFDSSNDLLFSKKTTLNATYPRRSCISFLSPPPSHSRIRVCELFQSSFATENSSLAFGILD